MTTPRPMTRRAVARGLAWSVPAVAATAAAPAFAASRCTPVLRFSGGPAFNYGVVGTAGGTTTTQKLDVGGQTYVDNLPDGVTVDTVTYQIWIENRIDGTAESRGPGFYWIGNKYSDRKTTCTATKTTGVYATPCTANWSPTAGSGFATTVTNTQNLSNQKYPDGVTRPSWDINMSWSAAKAPGTYTPVSNSTCRNFDTGPSGRFLITYNGVRRATTAAEASTQAFIIVTATLSTGKVLTATIQST